jgi:hypothetical protein
MNHAPPPARILHSMEIEQVAPKKPNFLLVLILFGAALLVIFLLALIFLHFDKRHLGLRHKDAHPTSVLVLPWPTLPARTA